jgi:uncharacterized protein
MIEVTVDDILVRTPKSEEATWTGPKDWLGKLGPLYVVLLKEQMGERILPIWVGTPEGSALALQLSAISTPRPMTHDLTARLLEVVEAKIERVTVTRLHENTFYATIGVSVGERVHDVDARPSDALNLALRMHAPIFVGPEVFEQTDVLTLTSDRALSELEEKYRKDVKEKRIAPETVEMEYRSFRTLPRGEPGSRVTPAEKEP